MIAIAAQLTDLHLGSASDPLCVGNMQRFEACVDTLTKLLRPPDIYIVTGDITEHGDRASYGRFLDVMARIDRPWLWTCGNHDVAATFDAVASASSAAGLASGGVAEVGGWRIVCSDTSLAGRQGGYFDDGRAALLDARLSERPDLPTIVAVHHPPIAVGLDWIDPAPDEPWIALFGDVMSRHGQVRQIVCGHVHMPVMASFRGVPVSVAPATASQLWPENAAMVDARPDGRVLVIDGMPGFALHRLGPTGMTTTFGSPPIGEVRLRHDGRCDLVDQVA